MGTALGMVLLALPVHHTRVFFSGSAEEGGISPGVLQDE